MQIGSDKQLTFKSGRKRTRIQSLQAELVAVKGLVDLEKTQVARLSELVQKLVTKLAGLGLKVKFEKGELIFEAIHTAAAQAAARPMGEESEQ